MKCDICFTPIPIGKNTCPNCGNVIKKKSGIKSTTMEFDHIEEEQTSPIFSWLTTDDPKNKFDHIETKVKMPSFDHIPQIQHSTPKKSNNQKLEYYKNIIITIFIVFMFMIYMILFIFYN